MWIEWLRSCSYGAELEFGPPTSGESIAELQTALGVELPSDLSQLLSEADGVSDQSGLGVVWPAERILTDNLLFRTDYDWYMSFDSLLFFGDAGNGDQFAFPIWGNKQVRSDVYAWDHEDDSRRWIAKDLRTYIDGWLAGKITI